MEKTTTTRPPFLLHLLASAFLLVFLINLAGFLQALRSWNWLLAVGVFPHPAYLLFKTLLLALLSFTAALAIWGRRAFAPRLSQVNSLLFFLWYWFDRLVLTRNPLPFKNQLLPLLVSVPLLLFVLVSAWLLEPYMKETRKPPDDVPGG
jgi:hypothetical protein